MELVRCFLAIAPDRALRTQLAAMCEPLKTRFSCEPLRWVASENYHLTLAFMGTVTREDMRLAEAGLAKLMPAMRRFTYRLTRLGGFPDARPRVLAALPDRPAAFDAWRHAAVTALDAAGIVVERGRFHPHLTLARWRGKQAPPRALERTISLLGVADGIVMYESRGGRYLPQFCLAAGEVPDA